MRTIKRSWDLVSQYTVNGHGNLITFLLHILGASLLRKIMAAARDMAEHIIAHRQLESTLSQDDIDEWLLAVEAWESDSSKPNPFETTVSGRLTLISP
jgi:hypothetical protein